MTRLKTVPPTVALKGRYLVVLRSDEAPRRDVRVDTLEDASRAARTYIEEYNLGSNAFEGHITRPRGGEPVARISYNGKVWPPGGYRPGVEPLYPAKPSAPPAVCPDCGTHFRPCDCGGPSSGEGRRQVLRGLRAKALPCENCSLVTRRDVVCEDNLLFFRCSCGMINDAEAMAAQKEAP